MEQQNKSEITNIRSELDNSYQQCRICLKSHSSTWDLFRDGKNVIRKLTTFANVQVEEGDGLPSIICPDCLQLVDIAYDFKCQVENSDMKLRNTFLTKDSLSLTHSINKVISDAIADEFSQKVVSCNIENQSPPLNNISSKIEHFSVHSNEQLVSSPLNNSTNMIAFNITENCAEKHEPVTEVIEKNFIYQESEKLNISETLQEHNSSRVDENIHQNAEGHLDIDFEEEYVKIEEAQNRLEFKNDKIEKIPSTLEVANNVTENCNDFDDADDDDNEEIPLISRTQKLKCPKCIKLFSSRTALEKHVIVHKSKTKLRYVCYLCEKQFSHVGKLKSHYQDVHEKNKEDDKSEQNEINETENSKRIDKERHSSEKKAFKFSCKVCSKQFTYHKSFISHAKIHHEYKADELINESLPPKDTYGLSKSKEVESDDEEMLTEGLQCTKCGKLFATKRNLKRHLLTHTGLKYNCAMCGKEFSRVDKLKEHEQSKHKDEIFGDLSEDGFDDGTDNDNKSPDLPENRKKEKYNRPHQCNLCPKAFAQPQSLANHMERHKRVKDTQKRFLCEVCSKCFAQSGSLVAHMRTHTGVKPYVCNVCTKAFTKSTYLQLHLRTHSGEKPYICQYCSRAFARANTLARHITMHTGEAKYHCQICMKSFRRLTSLNEHTYTHTGQRPYACKICAKRYNNAGSLYAHTKKCKSQQQSNIVPTYPVSTESTENNLQNNISSPSNQLISSSQVYSQKKLMETTTITQPIPVPQFMIANVHNQKSLTSNIIQPFPVEDPNLYAMSTKQFKNPYYTIYPNM